MVLLGYGEEVVEDRGWSTIERLPGEVSGGWSEAGYHAEVNRGRMVRSVPVITLAWQRMKLKSKVRYFASWGGAVSCPNEDRGKGFNETDGTVK